MILYQYQFDDTFYRICNQIKAKKKIDALHQKESSEALFRFAVSCRYRVVDDEKFIILYYLVSFRHRKGFLCQDLHFILHVMDVNVHQLKIEFELFFVRIQYFAHLLETRLYFYTGVKKKNGEKNNNCATINNVICAVNFTILDITIVG